LAWLIVILTCDSVSLTKSLFSFLH
jgi:hypothetical protein